MAKIELIEGTDTASVTISPDELLDIRKEALRLAVTLYQGKGNYLTNEYAVLNLARSFEEHLTRNIGND